MVPVSKRAQAEPTVVLHVPGGGFGMTSCVTPANLLELWCRHSAKSWQVSATGPEVFQLVGFQGVILG